MNAMNDNVWVFLETNVEGVVVGTDLLNAAKDLAAKQGGKVVAVAIAGDTALAQTKAAQLGADMAIVIEGAQFENYSTDAYTSALCHLIEKDCPKTLLIASTPTGKDLATRVAARVGTGLVQDCNKFEFCDECKRVLWTRPVFGGQYMVEATTDSYPQIGVVRMNSFKNPPVDESRTIEVVKEDYTVPADSLRTTLLEIIKDVKTGEIGVEDAEVVVAGGRGVGSEEGFEVLWDLARTLGGTVAASRPVTDAGWVSTTRLVGQSGKTVAPKLYIACGISGAMQHTCGMRDSDCIVAINRNPDAEIFEIADYCVVGDLFKIVPVLNDIIKQARA